MAPPPSSPPPPSIGTRIADLDGFIGTIRYVGPVASSSSADQIYFGIEWDDTSRGKNDGSVIAKSEGSAWKPGDLVRHFKCINRGETTTAGSFIKVPDDAKKKKKKTINFGEGLFNIIKARYSDATAPLITNTETNEFLDGDCYAQTKGGLGRKKKIEFYGEQKLRDHQQVEKVDSIAVRSCFVSYVEENFDLTGFDHLLELDLMGNLLSGWAPVWDCLEGLKSLSKVRRKKMVIASSVALVQYNRSR